MSGESSKKLEFASNLLRKSCFFVGWLSFFFGIASLLFLNCFKQKLGLVEKALSMPYLSPKIEMTKRGLQTGQKIAASTKEGVITILQDEGGFCYSQLLSEIEKAVSQIDGVVTTLKYGAGGGLGMGGGRWEGAKMEECIKNYLSVLVPSSKDYGTEAIAMAFSLDHNTQGLSMAISIAVSAIEYLSKASWLSKDIYFIFIEKGTPYSAGLRAWIEDHFYSTEYIPSRCGKLRAALNFEISTGKHPRVGLNLDSFDGLLPNYDLVVTAYMIASIFCSGLEDFTMWDRFFAVAFNAGRDSLNSPFAEMGVSSITLESVSQDLEVEYDSNKVLKVLESLVRTMSILSEALHHSTSVYLVVSKSYVLKIDLYIAIFAIINLILLLDVLSSFTISPASLLGIFCWLMSAVIGGFPVYLLASSGKFDGLFARLGEYHPNCYEWNPLQFDVYIQKTVAWLLMGFFSYSLAGQFLRLMNRQLQSCELEGKPFMLNVVTTSSFSLQNGNFTCHSTSNPGAFSCGTVTSEDFSQKDANSHENNNDRGAENDEIRCEKSNSTAGKAEKQDEKEISDVGETLKGDETVNKLSSDEKSAEEGGMYVPFWMVFKQASQIMNVVGNFFFLVYSWPLAVLLSPFFVCALHLVRPIRLHEGRMPCNIRFQRNFGRNSSLKTPKNIIFVGICLTLCVLFLRAFLHTEWISKNLNMIPPQLTEAFNFHCNSSYYCQNLRGFWNASGIYTHSLPKYLTNNEDFLLYNRWLLPGFDFYPKNLHIPSTVNGLYEQDEKSGFWASHASSWGDQTASHDGLSHTRSFTAKTTLLRSFLIYLYSICRDHFCVGSTLFPLLLFYVFGNIFSITMILWFLPCDIPKKVAQVTPSVESTS